ncbi:MAG: DUF2130 domain-containing protein [Chitinophagaceae bacterium]|nr:DUF2130 domain-containing protein [Chitinophagaceae bacterium]
MTNNINCPSCGHSFALGEAETEEYKKELRKEMQAYKEKSDTKIKQREEEFEKEKALIQSDAQKKIRDELQVKLSSLEDENRRKTQQLQEQQKKELDLLRERNELEQRTKNIDLEIEKRLLEDRNKMEQDITSREKELFDLRMKEKELQLDSMKKTIEDLKRKSEQGSMQTQGEAQELVLEDKLREFFPFDTVVEVGKGVEGADCMLIVRNNIGTECGKIIFESKRTKAWTNVWVDKLKTDMRTKQADLAILVTQVFPKGMDCFGERDGVWLCTFKELFGMSSALRNAIIRISESKKSEENKGEKMQMLYNYLTGLEFRQQIEAIVEGFISIKNSISKERIQMEKIWKEREKQLDKVLLSTSGMYGSVKGIAGASVQNIPLLEGTEDDEKQETD